MDLTLERSCFSHADNTQTIPIPTVMKVFKPQPYQKPVDTVIASFLDTAYLPERLQHSWLPWALYDKTLKGLHYISGGTGPGPDQWVGAIQGDRNNVDSCRKLSCVIQSI